MTTPPPARLAAAEAERLPDSLASYRDKITVTFERRPDGGLRVYSDELPGLALSNADHAAALADLKPAMEVLMTSRLTAAEAARDAAVARAERLEGALIEAAEWHDSKADNLRGRPQSIDTRWRTAKHVEEAERIRTALASE